MSILLSQYGRGYSCHSFRNHTGVDVRKRIIVYLWIYILSTIYNKYTPPVGGGPGPGDRPWLSVTVGPGRSDRRGGGRGGTGTQFQ